MYFHFWTFQRRDVVMKDAFMYDYFKQHLTVECDDPVALFEAFRLANGRSFHFSNFPLNTVEVPDLTMDDDERFLQYLMNANCTRSHTDMSYMLFVPGRGNRGYGLIADIVDPKYDYGVETIRHRCFKFDVLARLELIDGRVVFSVHYMNKEDTTTVLELIDTLKQNASKLVAV